MNVSLSAASAPAQSASVLPLLHPVLPPGEPTVATVPHNWRESDRRYTFLQTYDNLFLEIRPDGVIQGSRKPKPVYGILVLMSYLSSVIIKGYVSDLYLCMNNVSQIYASKNYNSSCTFNETMLPSHYNTYHHSRHKMRKKKFYLGLNKDGTVRTGFEARWTQRMSWFLPLSVSAEKFAEADAVKENIQKGMIITSRPAKVVSPEKRRKEQTRKRRRRWCKKLKRILRNPIKYTSRCKHDCDILRKMISNPRRSLRRCRRAQQRRRARNRAMRNKATETETRSQQLHRHRHRHGSRRRRHRRRQVTRAPQRPRQSPFVASVIS